MDDITTNPVNGGNNQANPQLNSTDVQIPGPVGEAASDTQNVPINTGLSNDSAQVPVNSNQPTEAPQVPQVNIDDIRSQINALDNANNSNQDIDFDSKKEEAAPVATPVPVIAPTAEVKPEFKPTMPEENAADSKTKAEESVAPKIFSFEDIMNKDVLEILDAPADISDEDKDRIYLNLAKVIENRLIVRLDDEMMTKDPEGWENALKEANQDKIKQILEQNNIDYKSILIEEVVIVRGELASLVGGLKD